MRVLLTNDDGIDAPGLAALAAAVQRLPTIAGRAVCEAVTVAPAAAMSGCGHQVTADRPIRAEPLAAGRVAVHGTPADCVRLALFEFAPQVDWVISGINAGGNLGADVYMSGTVAAAREAAMHGRPAVAVSHYRQRGRDFDWPRAANWVAGVLAELLSRPTRPGVFWNVNLPHPEPDAAEPTITFCELDAGPMPVSFRREPDGHFRYDGVYQNRSRAVGRDVDVCFSGRIAVTELRL